MNTGCSQSILGVDMFHISSDSGSTHSTDGHTAALSITQIVTPHITRAIPIKVPVD